MEGSQTSCAGDSSIVIFSKAAKSTHSYWGGREEKVVKLFCFLLESILVFWNTSNNLLHGQQIQPSFISQGSLLLKQCDVGTENGQPSLVHPSAKPNASLWAARLHCQQHYWMNELYIVLSQNTGQNLVQSLESKFQHASVIAIDVAPSASSTY